MSWIYTAYCWPSEVAWLNALADEGWQDGAPPDVELLVSGALYTPGADGDEQGAAIPGWHVAAAFRSRLAPAAWTPLEVEPPVGMLVMGKSAVPDRVTNFQARVVLMQTPSGEPGISLFDVIDSTLRADKATSTAGALAWQAWEQANDFYRNGALVNTLAGQFGLTQPQIDGLFRAASGIDA